MNAILVVAPVLAAGALLWQIRQSHNRRGDDHFVTKPSPRPSLAASTLALRKVALGFTGIGLLNAAVGVIFRHAPLSYLVIVPALTFAIYFGGGLVLLQTGALRGDPADATQLDVSPWFAWLVCGCLVAFFLGLIVVGGRTTGEAGLRTGGIAAAGWAGLIAILWIVRRLFRAAA